jgi:hypothetical protein
MYFSGPAKRVVQQCGDAGSLPLDLFQSRMESWIAAKKQR